MVLRRLLPLGDTVSRDSPIKIIPNGAGELVLAAVFVDHFGQQTNIRHGAIKHRFGYALRQRARLEIGHPIGKACGRVTVDRRHDCHLLLGMGRKQLRKGQAHHDNHGTHHLAPPRTMHFSGDFGGLCGSTANFSPA